MVPMFGLAKAASLPYVVSDCVTVGVGMISTSMGLCDWTLALDLWNPFETTCDANIPLKADTGPTRREAFRCAEPPSDSRGSADAVCESTYTGRVGTETGGAEEAWDEATGAIGAEGT